MRLTPGISIGPGETVTRQSIYNLVANAQGGDVEASDLSSDVQTIVTQSLAPSPWPGKLWWDQTDQVMKLYVDVLDGTGVSLWIAIGPDRFDIPMLATEPLPFGAAVQFSGSGNRQCRLPPNPLALVAMNWRQGLWEQWKVFGFNNDGPSGAHLTTASGAWFACAVDGICWCWYPMDKQNATVGFASSLGAAAGNCDGLISGYTTGGAGPYTAPTGGSDVRGGLIWYVTNANVPLLVSSLNLTRATNAQLRTHWVRRLFVGARQGRITG
jgi:hypothetical protein